MTIQLTSRIVIILVDLLALHEPGSPDRVKQRGGGRPSSPSFFLFFGGVRIFFRLASHQDLGESLHKLEILLHHSHSLGVNSKLKERRKTEIYKVKDEENSFNEKCSSILNLPSWQPRRF
jgi:hypothetical protein